MTARQELAARACRCTISSVKGIATGIAVSV